MSMTADNSDWGDYESRFNRRDRDSLCELAQCGHADCSFAYACDTLEFSSDLPAEQFWSGEVQTARAKAAETISNWESFMVAQINASDPR